MLLSNGARCLKDFDHYLKIYNVIHIKSHLRNLTKYMLCSKPHLQASECNLVVHKPLGVFSLNKASPVFSYLILIYFAGVKQK